MYDLFFISYNEPNADENWKKLSSRFVHAKRISNVDGIAHAHKYCAKQSYTKMFWTVDADTIVDDSWEFNYSPPEWDQQYLHLWYSRNPLNSLIYGYGAIKLWPTRRVLKYQDPWLDFTTSVGNIKIINETISTTMFNSSPYETWKSVFREVIKLQLLVDSGIDQDALYRLEQWGIVDQDAAFSNWATSGYADALEFYSQKNDLKLINDFRWLPDYFSQKYQSKVLY